MAKTLMLFQAFQCIPKFLDALEIAIKEIIPLSHFVLQRCLQSGFALKEEVIKTQHNTTHAPRWSASAKHYKFYLIMHEHLFIFRKPAQGENLSRIQYSTWKGIQKVRAAEIEEEWKGLLDWENKKLKGKSK